MVSDSIGNGSIAPTDTRSLLSLVATIIVGNAADSSSFLSQADARSTVSGRVTIPGVADCSVVPLEAIDSVPLCHFFALPLSSGGHTCFLQIAF
jgi:hypothetical protein